MIGTAASESDGFELASLEFPRRARVALLGALAAMSGVILLSWAVLAVVHADDRYAINHVAGAWIALAKYADLGTLYPPLYEDGSYGGTRFMPLSIVVHAGAAKLVGSFVTAGKLVSYILAACLLALLYVVARRRGCPRVVALALTTTILVSAPGLLAATSIRGDTLPVVLQLGALALVARSTRPRLLVAAGVLCALALLAKLTAVWGLAAIALLLLFSNRARLAPFLGSFAGTLAGGLAFFHVVSDGRMGDNVVGLAASDAGPSSLVVGVVRFAEAAAVADATIVLVPFAVVSIAIAAMRRRLDVHQLALLCAVPLLVVVFSDPGTSGNHLLDFEVLTVVVAAGLYADASAGVDVMSVLQAAVLVAVLWASFATYQATMSEDTRAALRVLRGGGDDFGMQPIRRYVGQEHELLSEDASLDVSFGKLPTVLDAYMLLRLGREHPEWIRALITRIERKQFERVVLLNQLDDAGSWYETQHFGSPVAAAMSRNYRLLSPVAVELGGKTGSSYWVYAPKAG